ncbi:hypothetical protein K6V43_04495 [Streptococcus suis]|nr:hypothetical protein [Streptococcus suis]
MNQKEWVEIFKEINGRPPSPQEFEAGKKAGEFVIDNTERKVHDGVNFQDSFKMDWQKFEETSSNVANSFMHKSDNLVSRCLQKVNKIKEDYRTAKDGVESAKNNTYKNFSMIFGVIFILITISQIVESIFGVWILRMELYGLLLLILIALLCIIEYYLIMSPTKLKRNLPISLVVVASFTFLFRLINTIQTSYQIFINLIFLLILMFVITMTILLISILPYEKDRNSIFEERSSFGENQMSMNTSTSNWEDERRKFVQEYSEDYKTKNGSEPSFFEIEEAIRAFKASKMNNINISQPSKNYNQPLEGFKLKKRGRALNVIKLTNLSHFVVG